jgi:hypothetical protein
LTIRRASEICDLRPARRQVPTRADIPGCGLGRLNWADSATIGAASGRTGVRPIAAISIGGRNRLQCALVRFPLGYRFVLEISEAARDRPKAVYCRCVRGKYMCSVAGDPQRVGNAAWLCLARCLSRNRLGPPTFWDKMQATALEISRNPFANARRPAVSPKSSGG